MLFLLVTIVLEILSSPQYTLDVNGDINISSGSTLRIGGTEAVFSNWSVDGSDNIYRSSNVGIILIVQIA